MGKNVRPGPPPFRSRVERVKLMQFAAGLHLIDPIHFDVQTAQAAGYRDLVAPPGYVISNTVQSRSAKLVALGIDERRALAGEMTFEHAAVICAGDELCGQSRLVARKVIDGERPKTLFTIETIFRNQDDEEVLTVREIIIEDRSES